MSVKNIEIAERMKAIRELSDIAPEEMAVRVGMAPEEYLAYESGEKDIPVSLLYDICNELKLSMTELLTGDTPKLHNFSVVRKSRGLAVDRNDAYIYQNLAFHFADRKIEPLLVTIPGAKRKEDYHFNFHRGQEYHYCLEGSYKICIDGKEILLGEGDSLYFDSSYPHAMKAANENDAKILVIVI
ncbi:MAG: cupin domain-containing protein [Clostridia bacterium]|nr:cupin domain-containing protein [Clostridia bacterium]MBR2327647.1 cupin domain-containing protein [Clostridia bacterium]